MFQGSKSKKPEIATVLAAYTATSAEQLNLSRGQLIMIRKKSNTGWWEGELQVKSHEQCCHNNRENPLVSALLLILQPN